MRGIWSLTAATHTARLAAAVMASGAVSALCRETVTCVQHRETLVQGISPAMQSVTQPRKKSESSFNRLAGDGLIRDERLHFDPPTEIASALMNPTLHKPRVQTDHPGLVGQQFYHQIFLSHPN